MTTIVTSQAPDAKPVGVSKNLDTGWQTLITVPEYEVPEQIFGGTTFIVPGAAEIITPLLVCNTSAVLATISLRILRKVSDEPEEFDYFTLLNGLVVQPNDLITIPLNGQVFITGEQLEATANASESITVHISYTVGQPEQDDVLG
jgi:hypothetical protein